MFEHLDDPDGVTPGRRELAGATQPRSIPSGSDAAGRWPSGRAACSWPRQSAFFSAGLRANRT